MLMSLDIAKALKFYDLGSLESATKAFHGFVNETVFIRTSEGRFVMRRNQRGASEESLRYRHALISWLHERDFSCPWFIPTRDGDTLLSMDGRIYEIMPFIDGKDYDSTRPQQLFGVGEILAQYHLAIQGFEPPSREQSPRYSTQNVMAVSERLLERDMMGDLHEELVWYDLRSAQLRSLLPSSTYQKLPHVVVHGDVHRDNFLFDHNDEAVALLDYDQVTWDARITDLADAIIGFSSECSTPKPMMSWGVYKGPFSEDCATQLIAAYDAVAPLTISEISALPRLIELSWLQGELGRVFSTSEGSPEYHRDVLGQGRWLSRWINDRYDQLVERWTNLHKESFARFSSSASAA